MANEIYFGAIPIEDIQIGMKVSYSQTITDSDIKTFAGLSGDHNPVHVDEKFKLDTWYVENRSLWLDFKIMVKTLLVVVRRENISQANHVTTENFKGNKR